MNEVNMMETVDKRMNGFEERLRKTELALERNNVITEKNTEILEKFEVTLESVKNTMVIMSLNGEKSNQIIGNLTENVGRLTEKIEKVDKKVEEYKNDTDSKFCESEKKNKIDTRDVLKRWIEYLIIGGGAGTIVYTLLNYSR